MSCQQAAADVCAAVCLLFGLLFVFDGVRVRGSGETGTGPIDLRCDLFCAKNFSSFVT